MMISLASMTLMPASGNEHYGKPTLSVARAKTVTQKGQALVKSPRIAKPKLFRSNPYRLTTLLNATDGDDIDIDDEAKITGYRKRDFGKVKVDPTSEDPDGIITEDIRWKLFLARQAAMLKYRTVHG